MKKLLALSTLVLALTLVVAPGSASAQSPNAHSGWTQNAQSSSSDEKLGHVLPPWLRQFVIRFGRNHPKVSVFVLNWLRNHHSNFPHS